MRIMYCFENELGRRISVEVENFHPEPTPIRFAITSRDSQDEGFLTRMEASRLRDSLNIILTETPGGPQSISPQRSPVMIEELRLADGRYIYFAKIDDKWTDLAPWGNRIPETV